MELLSSAAKQVAIAKKSLALSVYMTELEAIATFNVLSSSAEKLMKKFLVISDLHAMSKELRDAKAYSGSAGGTLFAEKRLPRENQVLSIKSAAWSHKGQIDALFCLGDIAHQAKELVSLQVWRDICKLASDLEIETVFAVTGNHDIASRPADFENRPPNDLLRILDPPYPSEREDLKSQYEQKHFATWSDDEFFYLAIDTCSLHGLGGSEAKQVFNRGHISEQMLQEIEVELGNTDASAIIVLMHHHPRRVDEIVDREYDEIENGERFLELLSSSQKPSLVMHGHKHFVNLQPAGDSAWSPILFSASSLAASVYENMERYFSNQFHIVEVEHDQGLTALRGKIRSWDWEGIKWTEAVNPRMPAEIGFGRRKSVDDIARELYEAVKDGGGLTGGQPFDISVDLQYCNIADIKSLKVKLETEFSVKLIRDSQGDIAIWKQGSDG